MIIVLWMNMCGRKEEKGGQVVGSWLRSCTWPGMEVKDKGLLGVVAGYTWEERRKQEGKLL